MRVTSTRARIGAAIFGVTAACCESVQQQSARLTSRATGTIVMNPSSASGVPKGISVRPATAAEAYPLLTNMINRAFRSYAVERTGDDERVSPDGKQVASLMATPRNAFLVAEELKGDASSRVVGCVHVAWSGVTDSNDEDVDAHFGMLCVEDECGGRGIGKLLVSAAEDLCRKELGRENICMEISVVSFLPKLCRWYEAQGYRVKRAIPFPVPGATRHGSHFDLLIMTKTIP
ncbi:unnamed protein product [Scytosiphon promiscuus]